MKHLKIYELYNKKDIKKYTVYVHENKDYFIDRIANYKGDSVIYHMLCKYDNDTDEINDTDVSDIKSECKIDKYIPNVLFTSKKIR
jgi:hypothetical protein